MDDVRGQHKTLAGCRSGPRGRNEKTMNEKGTNKTYERKLLLMERLRLLVSDSWVEGRRTQRRRSRGNPWLHGVVRDGL